MRSIRLTVHYVNSSVRPVLLTDELKNKIKENLIEKPLYKQILIKHDNNQFIVKTNLIGDIDPDLYYRIGDTTDFVFD